MTKKAYEYVLRTFVDNEPKPETQKKQIIFNGVIPEARGSIPKLNSILQYKKMLSARAG
jgi:hypothetical protein